jgi:hypothetical protein
MNGHRTVVLAALSTLSTVVLIACSSTSSNSGSGVPATMRRSTVLSIRLCTRAARSPTA